jgi:hypothetical protein
LKISDVRWNFIAPVRWVIRPMLCGNQHVDIIPLAGWGGFMGEASVGLGRTTYAQSGPGTDRAETGTNCGLS